MLESRLNEKLNPQTVQINVPDIRCAACAFKIEERLLAISGVKRCRTNLATKNVYLDVVDVPVEDLFGVIDALGFSPIPFVGGDNSELKNESKKMLARLGVAGIGMMQVMMFALANYVAGDTGMEAAYVKLMAWASLAISTPVILYSAMPFHIGALKDLMQKKLGMDVPVSLAIISAYSLSIVNLLSNVDEMYFDSVCMFTFLLLVGRFVELQSRSKYVDSMEMSDHCLPKTANVIRGSAENSSDEMIEERPLDDLAVGDHIRVYAGDLIPVDGTILSGLSSVSEAAFTGESTPLTKSVGAKVQAGSVNLEADLTVEMRVLPSEFVIQKMSELYRESILHKPKFALLADYIAQYFVAGILLLAVVSSAVWYLWGAERWFVIGLTVLVVSCPCALSLATPVAYTMAITALRKVGVIVGRGEFLEKVTEIDEIVFDKTGTLTRGKLVVGRVDCLGDLSERTVLEYCAALERISLHPIARAFEQEISCQIFSPKAFIGEGVEGEIDGILYRLGKPSFCGHENVQVPEGAGTWLLLSAGEAIAWIQITDQLRPGVVEAIKDLKAFYRVSLLTGDSLREAERIADIVGIGNLDASASPEKKADTLIEIQNHGHRVLMVGDGVNDAAAMGSAHASIAINPVDIVVQEAADVTLLQNDISDLMRILKFAKKVKKIIRQNIGWAVGYNLSVIPLAVTGNLEPWMAALGMSASSLVVVFNANRLRTVGET